MDLTYAFRLPVSADVAWSSLADVAGVAAHVPGAVVDSVVGDLAMGHLAVKVGPVMVRYDGALTVKSQDAEAREAVLRAKGTEARGDGEAAATITVHVAPDGADLAAALVTVAAVLDVTGRIARFGHGVLDDVGERMVGQLAEGLGGGLVPAPAAAAEVAEVEVEEVEQVEVDASAGTSGAVVPAPPAATTSTARKVGPVLIGIAVLWLLKKLLSRSKR